MGAGVYRKEDGGEIFVKIGRSEEGVSSTFWHLMTPDMTRKF
jgi:hypothetical protein